MSEVNWDFMFDPPSTRELDIEETNVGEECEFCFEEKATHRIREEMNYLVWTSWRDIGHKCLWREYGIE